jgi:hypothetical protein
VFNGRTLIALAATLVAIAVLVAAHVLVEVGYRARRRLPLERALHAVPTGLVVAAACVLMSRVVHFRPGYLYGVIAGVVFVRHLDKREEGQSAALVHLGLLVLGVVTWLVWVPVSHAATHHASSAPLAFLVDLLSSVFVGSLVSTTLRLLPLSFFPGGAVAKWHRGAWSVVFGVALFGMLAVMLNPNSSSVHTGASNWITAIVLLAFFGAASIAFAAYWQRRDAHNLSVATES